jgi:hypothetical protein
VAANTVRPPTHAANGREPKGDLQNGKLKVNPYTTSKTIGNPRALAQAKNHKSPLGKRARSLARALVKTYATPPRSIDGLVKQIDDAGLIIKSAQRRGITNPEVWAAMREAHRDAEAEIALDHADYELRGGAVLNWLLSPQNLASLSKSEQRRTRRLRNEMLYRRYVPAAEDERFVTYLVKRLGGMPS